MSGKEEIFRVSLRRRKFAKAVKHTFYDTHTEHTTIDIDRHGTLLREKTERYFAYDNEISRSNLISC